MSRIPRHPNYGDTFCISTYAIELGDRTAVAPACSDRNSYRQARTESAALYPNDTSSRSLAPAAARMIRSIERSTSRVSLPPFVSFGENRSRKSNEAADAVALGVTADATGERSDKHCEGDRVSSAAAAAPRIRSAERSAASLMFAVISISVPEGLWYIRPFKLLGLAAPVAYAEECSVCCCCRRCRCLLLRLRCRRLAAYSFWRWRFSAAADRLLVSALLHVCSLRASSAFARANRSAFSLLLLLLCGDLNVAAVPCPGAALYAPGGRIV